MTLAERLRMSDWDDSYDLHQDVGTGLSTCDTFLGSSSRGKEDGDIPEDSNGEREEEQEP